MKAFRTSPEDSWEALSAEKERAQVPQVGAAPGILFVVLCHTCGREREKEYRERQLKLRPSEGSYGNLKLPKIFARMKVV